MKIIFDHTVAQPSLAAGSPGIPARCSEGFSTDGEQGCSPNPQAGKPALPAERGIALVVTLILLTVITFLAVAFLYLSQRERGAVANAVEMSNARLAAEAATERAKAEMVARILASNNRFNYGLLVSTNYLNPLGFEAGNNSVTNVNYQYPNGNLVAGNDLIQNVANLFYSPRPPVFIVTNRVTGSNDFRFWLDLNRNGRFETNGFLPELNAAGLPILTLDTNGNTVVLSNYFVGDPEWVGLLERADRPHGPNNKFISRIAFCVVPSGLALDINAIHNQSKLLTAAQDGFSRNMGIGSYENNLAGLLVDLNTNFWNPVGAVYSYSTNPLVSSLGTAFEDAAALTRYRYTARWDGTGWDNLRSVSALFGAAGANAFLSDLADGYGAGPLLTSTYSPLDDPDAPNRVNFGWPGADNPRHFLTTQDLFDRNKTTAVDAGQTPLNNFTERLRNAGFGTSTYDRYTFYRLLSQLGTDSGPEPAKMHLNYSNVYAGKVAANAQTNFVPWQPLDFFTNAVDRLLRATFPNPGDNVQRFGVNQVLSITNIPVMVSNQMVYTPAIHRLLQVAANILDSSTNYSAVRGGADFPSVFRPRFEWRGAHVFISGFEEVGVVSGLGDSRFAVPVDVRRVATGQPLENVYGVPWVIGAKKGFPNFNEFAMQSIAQITRKLQVTKPSPSARPTATNQLFQVGISNMFAFEAWNSYSNRYLRAVDIAVANDMAIYFSFTNDARYDLRGGTIRVTNNAVAITNILANQWLGYGRSMREINTNSFLIPFATNFSILPAGNSIYRMNSTPPFFTGMTNVGNGLFRGFEQGMGFPQPELSVTVSNRIRFIMLDRDTRRVVDYVQLNDLNGARNLTSELNESDAPGVPVGQLNTAQSFWLTNRVGGNTVFSPPQGVVNQILASLDPRAGGINVGDWNSYGEGQAAGAIKEKEIAAFTKFMGFTPSPPYDQIVNTNIAMQVPFTPTHKTYQHLSWQANDPLVHFMAGDLQTTAEDQKVRTVSPPGTPIDILPNIGQLNDRFEPWGGDPRKETGTPKSGIPRYALAAKDPGVRASDDWDFPTNKYPTVGWLGRVHRGTPWQTIYLKSDNVDTGTWSRWTGNSNSLDAEMSRPIADRLVFDVFTAAFNEASTRGQLNVNQRGLAAWSAGLAGVIGLTNVSTDAQLLRTPPVIVSAPWVIEPAGKQGGEVTNTILGRIWAGINRTRDAAPFNGSFSRAADIVAVPELTIASPLLNTNSTFQLERGISDAMYERLPQMLMGLLRGNDLPRFEIYAYGQSLKPANRSIVTSSPRPELIGLCTNYQVTAEFATRTVVRIEGAPANPRAVVESFNLLAPDE